MPTYFRFEFQHIQPPLEFPSIDSYVVGFKLEHPELIYSLLLMSYRRCLVLRTCPKQRRHLFIVGHVSTLRSPALRQAHIYRGFYFEQCHYHRTDKLVIPYRCFSAIVGRCLMGFEPTYITVPQTAALPICHRHSIPPRSRT